MPDLDLVARSLTKPWRGAYLQLKRRSPPEIVAEDLLKALAASIRDTGGIPAFRPMLEVCEKARVVDSDSAVTLGEMIRHLENKFDQRQAVKVLARSALRYVAHERAGKASPDAVGLVKEYLASLLNHHFFARVAPRLVGSRKRFATVEEARSYKASVLSFLQPGLDSMARRLAADPDNPRIRAPKSSRQRLTTEELIDMPLGGGHGEW